MNTDKLRERLRDCKFTAKRALLSEAGGSLTVGLQKVMEIVDAALAAPPGETPGLRWYSWVCINGHRNDHCKMAADGTKLCVTPGCQAEAEVNDRPAPADGALREAYEEGLGRMWGKADYPRLFSDFAIWAKEQARQRYPLAAPSAPVSKEVREVIAAEICQWWYCRVIPQDKNRWQKMSENAKRDYREEADRIIALQSPDGGLTPEEQLARIVFNSDGEEIGRNAAKMLMYGLRTDYNLLCAYAAALQSPANKKEKPHE